MPALAKSILIADDDAAMLEMLRMLLEEEKFTVLRARTPEAALAALQESPVDLVLTDAFSSTPTDTLEATAELRQAAGETPIVLLTAHVVDADAVRDAGFAASIAKPFDVDLLLKQVHALLE
jgi:DNA-binding response OmpR family regulator